MTSRPLLILMFALANGIAEPRRPPRRPEGLQLVDGIRKLRVPFGSAISVVRANTCSAIVLRGEKPGSTAMSVEAAQQEAGASEKHHRQGNLRRHQRHD